MNIYENLLDLVKTEDDFEEFLTEHSEWEYIYNLSNIRRNLLDWYEFDKKASLLEIGAECGALTGLFLERVSKVVSYEEDEEKAEILKARYGKKKKLAVITSSLDDISQKYPDGFDYVTVIGSPSHDVIKKAISMMKKGGTIFVACDNKYGTGRWSQDIDMDKYSRSGLVSAIKYSGADKDFRVYYPVPNFVLPMEIYSEQRLPKTGDIRDVYPNYIEGKYVVFNENRTIDSLIEDGMYEQFANSFLMIGSKSE